MKDVNWFAYAQAVLQIASAGVYCNKGRYEHALLWLLYGLATLVLVRIAK